MKNKLSPFVCIYWIFKSLILVVIVGIIVAFLSHTGSIQATINNQPTTINVGQYGSMFVFGIPFVLFVLLALYQIVYYATFSYVVSGGQISITSGILFSSTKTIDFRMVQDVSSKRGPILMIFGLRALQGFTSSPDQFRVSGPSFRLGGRGNTHTTYRPDINILLPTAVAEQLKSQIATSAETPNVHVV